MLELDISVLKKHLSMWNSLVLCLILVLAFLMAFIPHMGYAYPVHVDEWMHLTYAKAIAQTGSIIFPDPFSGQGTMEIGNDLWIGFHVYWATFQQVSNIDWITLVRFFPPIIFVVTVLIVYILANRLGFGIEAAFFTCLIPTTIGLLGPAFMVPMAMALLFIPTSLFLAFYIKSWKAIFLLFLVICALLLIHPTTAIILCIILAPYVLLSIWRDPGHNFGILAAMILPFIIPFPWLFKRILPTLEEIIHPQYQNPAHEVPALILMYGILPIVLSFIGSMYMFKKGNRQNNGIIFGLVFLLAIMFVFLWFHYGLLTIYQRGLTIVLLLISLIAGAGLYWIRTLQLPAKFTLKIGPRLIITPGIFLCCTMAVITLSMSVPNHFNTPYYHMIDDRDYHSFIWIKDNIKPEYNVALVDPWKATAFVAVSGKNIIHRIWSQKDPADEIIEKYLLDGCPDTSFLADNNVSLVYNTTPCRNSDLDNINTSTYIIKPSLRGNLTPHQDSLQSGWTFESILSSVNAWHNWSENCEASFLYPQSGRNGGTSIGINVTKTAPDLKPWPHARWYQLVNIAAGKSYQISGWISTENITGNGGARLFAYWYGPGYKWISDTPFMTTIKGTNGWTNYSGKVTAPAGAERCMVGCIMGNCTGTAWFDDLVFKEE